MEAGRKRLAGDGCSVNVGDLKGSSGDAKPAHRVVIGRKSS